MSNNKSILSNLRYVLNSFVLGISVGDRNSGIAAAWNRRISGAWLLFMYGLVFYIVMMSLTAYQIQTRIHAADIDGEKLTIWGVTRAADEIVRAQIRIDQLVSEKHYVENQNSEIIVALEKTKSKLLTVQDELASEIRALNPEFEFGNEGGFSKFHREAITFASKLNKSQTGKLAYSKYKTHRDEFDEKLAKFTAASINQSTIESRLATLKSELVEIKEARPNHKKIMELTDELHFFYTSYSDYEASWVGKIYAFMLGGISTSDRRPLDYSFVILPSEVLMMLIVIAMGTMGSLINITQQFFAGENKPITYYLFRPLLGAVVAIGIYIVTKAGVLVSTNIGTDLNGATKLNAFFVSFISLIAGLMSESAIRTIKEKGTSFLQGTEEPEKPRYANGILEILKKKKKDKNGIYPYFDLAHDEIDKWFSETHLVPEYAQRIISAWVEEPVRNLFTDIRSNGTQPAKTNQ